MLTKKQSSEMLHAKITEFEAILPVNIWPKIINCSMIIKYLIRAFICNSTMLDGGNEHTFITA